MEKTGKFNNKKCQRYVIISKDIIEPTRQDGKMITTCITTKVSYQAILKVTINQYKTCNQNQQKGRKKQLVCVFNSYL